MSFSIICAYRLACLWILWFFDKNKLSLACIQYAYSFIKAMDKEHSWLCCWIYFEIYYHYVCILLQGDVLLKYKNVNCYDNNIQK